MTSLYSYNDDRIYCHHTRDAVPNPLDFPMQVHNQFEILYVISGRGGFLVEGTRYALSSGDIMIMRQAETHKLIISPDEPYERIAVHFSPALFSPFGPQLLAPFLDRPLGHGNHFSGAKYPALCSAFRDFDFSDSRVQYPHIFARLLLFLSELADVYEAEHRDALLQNDSSELVGYVNAHLFEALSVDSVSRQFMKSTAQIARDFKKATGSPMRTYIRIKRLLAAQAMLRRGDMPTKVCTACGFNDYSAFFRAFRAYFGYSPGDSAVFSERLPT